MNNSKLLQNLKKTIGDGDEYMITNSHDKAEVAVGLLNLEAAEEIKNALDRVSLNMASQVGRIIKSNDKLRSSNDNYVCWFKILTSGLIIVGLLQLIFEFFKK